MAKYASSQQLASYVGRYKRIWRFSASLSRQIASVTPRLKNEVGANLFIESTFVETGQLDALRILLNIQNIDKNLDRHYIMHLPGKIKFYPLSKFLILMAYLQNDKADAVVRHDLRKEICEKLCDPLLHHTSSRN